MNSEFITNSAAVESGLQMFNSDIIENMEVTPVIVYHGSPNKFETFKPDFMRSNGTSEGIGFYFTNNKEIAAGYAQNGYLYTVEFEGEKALSDSELTITYEELKKLIIAMDNEGITCLDNYGEVAYEGFEKVLNMAIVDNLEWSDNDIDLISGLYNAAGEDKKVLELIYTVLGYDHYIVEHPDWGQQKIYIALTNEIIKITEVESI